MPTATATAVTPSALGNAVMAKLYDVLTNGDDTVPRSEDNFLAWVTPAYPVTAEDFEFCSQGLTGVLKKDAVQAYLAAKSPSAPTGDTASGEQPASAPSSGAALSPEDIDRMLGADTARLYMQAEAFSRMVDFVPDTSGIQARTSLLNVMNNEGSLSDRYEYVLTMSQVAAAELSEKERKFIEEGRASLFTKTKVKTGPDTETEIENPTPLSKTYSEHLAAYEAAALEYNTHRIDALAALNPKAQHYWRINGNALRNRVKAAMNDWIVLGRKMEYEGIANAIAQITKRDLTQLKAQYVDSLQKAVLTGAESGSDFYYATVVPGNWVKASSWTQFDFASSDFHYYEKRASNSGGGLISRVGLFHGGGAHGNKESAMSFDTNRFSLHFEIAQVPIVLPWFKTAFLCGRSWRFSPSVAEAKDLMLSDGGNPPKGFLPAYPTAMICIKNLVLKSSQTSQLNELYTRSTAAGGRLSLGPFNLGGSYASGKSERKQEAKVVGESMNVEGMQIVGFKCHLVPKAPEPLQTITNWV